MIPRIFLCKNCGVLLSIVADPDEPRDAVAGRGVALHGRSSPLCRDYAFVMVYPEYACEDGVLARCIIPRTQKARRTPPEKSPSQLADPACFICAGLGVWIGDPCSCVTSKAKGF